MVRTSPQQTTELKTLLPPIPRLNQDPGDKEPESEQTVWRCVLPPRGRFPTEEAMTSLPAGSQRAIKQVVGYYISYILEAGGMEPRTFVR